MSETGGCRHAFATWDVVYAPDLGALAELTTADGLRFYGSDPGGSVEVAEPEEKQ